MSTAVKCSATTKKGTKCNYKAKYGTFCGRHCPKDQVTPVVKKAKVARAPRLNTSRANQLIKENNILLRAIADKVGLNVEQVLLPVTKKYCHTYNDEDIKPEEEAEDEELLNWDKKPTEVKEITPEVSVKKEREIEEEEKEVEEVPWDLWVVKENEGVEMVTPEIMPSCTKEIKTKEPAVIEENKFEEPTVIKEVKEEIKTKEPIVVEEVKEEIKTKEPTVMKENQVEEPIFIQEAKTNGYSELLEAISSL